MKGMNFIPFIVFVFTTIWETWPSRQHPVRHGLGPLAQVYELALQ